MRRTVASTLGLGLLLGRLRGRNEGSGTLGALAAVPLWLAARRLGITGQLSLVGALAAAGLWSARPFARQGADPGWVVIDETAGAALALVGLGGWPAALAWTVARAGDITKLPPGVRAAERLPEEWGVMADDLVAGLYGLAAGWLLTEVRSLS